MENANNSQNRLKSRKIFRMALISAFAAGCGALPDPAEGLAIDAAELEQPLRADDNFGYNRDTYRACDPGTSATCYYPPSHDHPWNICLDATGLSATQGPKVVNAINVARDALAAHGVTIAFTKVGGCTSAQPIHIIKGGLAQLGSIDEVRNYGRLACTSSLLLSESPALPGVHRECYAYTLTVNANEIDNRYSGLQSIYDHAVGSMFGLASIGAALTSDSGHQTRWSYSSVLGPVNKFDFGSAAYCRYDAADWSAPDPLFIQKQDNGCD